MLIPSASNGEWFEVFNFTSDVVNLNGLTVMDNSGESFTVNTDAYIEPEDTFVFGASSNLSINGGVDVQYEYGSAMTLNDSFDSIKLIASGFEIDAVAYNSGGNCMKQA